MGNAETEEDTMKPTIYIPSPLARLLLSPAVITVHCSVRNGGSAARAA
jgi:hypothetical protein